MTNYRQEYQEYVRKASEDDASAILSYEFWLEQKLAESEEKSAVRADTLNKANDQLDCIRVMLNENEDFQREYRGYGTLADQVGVCFAWYRRRQEMVIGGAKAFNDDLIVYFRAIALVAEMVGNAGTHREKAARLRGLIEQIETAIQKLRDQSFDFTATYYWRAPDVWRSDYPLRDYLQRNQELERQIAELKGEKRPEYIPDDTDAF